MKVIITLIPAIALTVFLSTVAGHLLTKAAANLVFDNVHRSAGQ